MANESMKWNEYHSAYLMLHIAVGLFGLTAILGVLIDLSALQLVWWRVLLTAATLVFFLTGRRSLKTMSIRQIGIFLSIGGIVALHWLCFYGAIKLSNASITLICMATASFFTALIEPLIMRSGRRKQDIITGLAIVPGMILVVGGLTATQIWGVVVGLASAALAAVFSTLNKKYIESGNSITITFLEMVGATILLSMMLPFFADSQGETWAWPSEEDWLYLGILVVFCTTLAFILSLLALKQLTAFASNLVINLEPVYGIILAALILGEHEQLTPSFYLGGSVVILVVLGYPVIKKKWG